MKMKMERKRKHAEIGGDQPKKIKSSDDSKEDKNQLHSKPFKKDRKNKRQEFHAEQQNRKVVEGETLGKIKTIVSKSDTPEASQVGKNVLKKKKKRKKKKHAKSNDAEKDNVHISGASSGKTDNLVMKHRKRNKHAKVDSAKNDNNHSSDSNPVKNDNSGKSINDSSSNSMKKVRKPLTDRQKHKRWKLKQKKQLKSLLKQKKTNQTKTKKETDENSVSESNAEDSKDLKPKFEKVILPKGPEDASSNWKKLQAVIEAKKAKKKGNKGKRTPHPFRRNPKLNSVGRDKKSGKKEELAKPAETSKPDIWFDGVDEIFLEAAAAQSKALVPMETETKQKVSDKGDEKETSTAKNNLVEPDAYKGLTKVVGMDCEMVGVGDGRDSMLARVSIVNQYGETVYDKFVKPMEDVIDYRTHVSGVRQEDIEKGEEFFQVQKDVAKILKGKLLVGHALSNDLKVLYLGHPRNKIRDTSKYKPFRQLFQGRTPSLKKLTAMLLNVKVQEGEHNSVEDAQAAMRLYTLHRKKWEAEIGKQQKRRKEKKAKDKVLPVVNAASAKSELQKKKERNKLRQRKKKEN